MSEFIVKVGQEIPGFVDLFKDKDLSAGFSNLRAALNTMAMAYYDLWQKYANGAPIPPSGETIHSREGGYIKSIKTDLTKDYEKVIYTDSPVHKYIEDGHGPIDLKPGLLSGPKARHGKYGNYNIVSFRHGTPGTLPSNKPMPTNVYQYMLGQTRKAEDDKRLGFSRIIARTKRTQLNPGGRVGEWGVRLPAQLGGTLETKRVTLKGGEQGTYTWTTGKLTGMVRTKDVLSRGTSNQYKTFRVVSARSDPFSWIVPARPPLPIRQAVINTMQPILEKTIQEAINKDLAI